MEKEYFVVDGFRFDSEATFEKAKKELAGIEYIKNKLDLNNNEMVLNIYNQILEQNMFETPVGIYFMKEMQEYLISDVNIERERVASIPICTPAILHEKATESPVVLQELKKEKITNNPVEKKYKLVKMICIFLAVAVVSMFVIVATSNNPTILNYEKEILDRYASWEQDLTERETNLKIAE